MGSWWCGSRGLECEGREPIRLLTVQVGDTEQHQIVFLENAVPDGKCDNLRCALKPITNLDDGSEARKCPEFVSKMAVKKITAAVWQFSSLLQTASEPS